MRSMGITTKKGDRGKTQLCFGQEVSKDNIRVEIYGTLDELCSFLGLSKSVIKNSRTKNLIESIQRDLFTAGAELARVSRFVDKLKKRIGPQDVNRLERAIEDLEKKRSFEECCFYLPGENFISGTLDVARTVARRTERKIVTLKRAGLLKNRHILIYMNRLSDLLFLLARSLEKEHKPLPESEEPQITL